MRRTPLTVVASTCLVAALMLSVVSHAEDYESAHRVEAGEIISADMINELFDAVEESERTITADDLIGVWKGGAYGAKYFGVNGWFYSETHRCWALTNVTMTFRKETNGHYTVQTSAPNPFNSDEPGAFANRIGVVEGYLFGTTAGYTLDRIGKNRLRLSSDNISADYPRVITLDRRNLPPKKPKLEEAVVSSRDVYLRWKDNSDNEDGFIVWRRDKISKSYVSVAAVAANSTATTNIVPSAGFYWYRISATNAYGASLGSNVKRVVSD